MSQFQGRNLSCMRADRPVFAGLDFDLPAGGALLLTGPNGSGKSSLLRLMAGLLRPSAGQLTWDGADIEQDPEAHRARLRYLGHLDAVKPVLSLSENLPFASGLHGPVAEAALQNGLAAFALETLAGLPGRVLSAGQRRRLALARLAVSPGTLWLLDEPTVGLDTASQANLARLMAAHRAQGGRVAVATHVSLDLPGAVALDLAPHAEAARAAALEHAW